MTLHAIARRTTQLSEPTDDMACDLLEGLVRLASVSGQEQAASEWLVARMTALGFNAYVDEAGNAVGVIGDGRPETVLLGHIDTVAGEVEVRREDGRLYGRGTVDAKGPLAAFVIATARLHQTGQLQGRVVVVGCVEEEVPSSRGAHAVLTRYAPDTCIVGEPSGWNSVTLGYKGVLRATIRLQVPCGHSAHNRQTAAEQIVAIWQQLLSYTDDVNGSRTRAFDQLQPSLLQLYSGTNGLHEWANAEISVRLPLDIDPQSLVAILQRFDEAATIHVHGATAAFHAERTSSLVRLLSRAIRAHETPPRLTVKTGTADMNIVGPVWNCPIVAYGPGNSALDHTPNEHIVLEEYLRAIAILTATLECLHCASAVASTRT